MIADMVARNSVFYYSSFALLYRRPIIEGLRSCTDVLDIIIGVVIIVFCLGAATAFVFYSRRQIHRIALLKRSTYRDIMQNKHE